ncbi:hypothetical protein ACE103_25600 [Bradyrhizobium sp. ma5]|uniref:hypothetical protein n=1 Tax=Bradyrhizobium sp. ma5 TaxID=3344828 RepID=UPI0035D4B1F7
MGDRRSGATADLYLPLCSQVDRTKGIGGALTSHHRPAQTQSLEERLTEEAQSLREEAKTLPPSAKKEAMLRKARHDEVAAHLTEWLMSPGLKPPV